MGNANSQPQGGGVKLIGGSISMSYSLGTNGSDTLLPNQFLQPNGFLQSANKRYKLIMQTDGNFVGYQEDKPFWASNTSGRPGGFVIMQTDGNLVLNAGTAPINNQGAFWSSQTNGKGVPGKYRLVMRNDRNIVIYDLTNQAIWASNTNIASLKTYEGPENGVDYPGNDIQEFPNSDPNDCADRCNDRSECVGFATNSAGQNCWLKSSFGAPIQNDQRPTWKKPGVNTSGGAFLQGLRGEAARKQAEAVAAKQAAEAAEAARVAAEAEKARQTQAEAARAAQAEAARRAAAAAEAERAARAAAEQRAAEAAAAAARDAAAKAKAEADAKAAADAAAAAKAKADADAKAAADAAAAAKAQAAATLAALMERIAILEAAAKAQAEREAKAKADAEAAVARIKAEQEAAAAAAAAKLAAEKAAAEQDAARKVALERAAAEAKAAAEKAEVDRIAAQKAAEEAEKAAIVAKAAAQKKMVENTTKCLHTLRQCVANARDDIASAPSPSTASEGAGVYMALAPAAGKSGYTYEGAPYASAPLTTRTGVLVRILFAIFLILFVLYMSKQV